MDKETILLVGQDRDFLRSLNESLSSRYKLLSCADFKEALEKYQDQQAHTVVSQMDERGSGFEVITKLQRTREETPVIVITAHNSLAIAIEALKAGTSGYCVLPFNLDELKLVMTHSLERRKLQEELKGKDKGYGQESTLIDNLTQVYSRRYFDDMLQREEWRSKRYALKFSLLKIDVDDFKKFNDYYGAAAGDKVLSFLGAMLQSRIRNTDSVSRYTGQQFAVVTPHTDKQNAMILASRLLDAIRREEFLVEGNFRAKVTVSIGLATYNEDSFTRAELVKNTDLALQQAKRLGKNRVCLFGPAGS